MRLRPLTEDDVDAVHAYASLPEVSRYQEWGPNSYQETEEFVAAWIHDMATSPQERWVYAIELDGDMIGSGEFRIRGASAGEISYILHPRVWGRGLATTFARELIRLGFAEHHRHRIYATCDPRNIASGRVLAKAGMTYEGRMRDTMLLRDGWRDSDLYAILADDPTAPR